MPSADLVTLSACGSFQGEKINGEGIVGLTRGFIYAGAKTRDRKPLAGG